MTGRKSTNIVASKQRFPVCLADGYHPTARLRVTTQYLRTGQVRS